MSGDTASVMSLSARELGVFISSINWFRPRGHDKRASLANKQLYSQGRSRVEQGWLGAGSTNEGAQNRQAAPWL